MESDRGTILDQYKMYVETAERVSERRLKTNQFYIGLLSGLLAVLTFIFSQNNFSGIQKYENHMVTIVGILGVFINIAWLANLRSFRQLNRGKFKVIHEMESLLPFKPFDREWQIIQHGLKEDKYRQLTVVEQYLPVILTVPFLLLLLINFL